MKQRTTNAADKTESTHRPKHFLTAEVPSNVAPGDIEVLLHLLEPEDDVERVWMEGMSREWAEELSDPREEIYSREDGKPNGECG